MLELDLIVLVLLLLLSAFFSGTETALISVDRVRIRQLAKKKSKAAKLLEEFQASPQKMLTTILIGNNLVNIAAAAIATNIALQVFSNYAVGISVGIMTFLILVLGEITPKSLAVQNSEAISFLVVRPIKWLSIILSPLIWFLNGFTRIIIRIVGKPTDEALTEQDIKTMVTMGAEAGAIHEREKQMIHRIFKFNDISVEDVMTPRSEIKAVPASTSLHDVNSLLAETPYSRLPVYQKNLDNIIGIFYVKDIWDCLASGKTSISVRQLARPVIFAHQTKKIDSMLAEFQQTRNNMALVVDDYGGVLGLVTLEDLLEEIVGEILDEIELPMIEKVSPGCFEADGRTSLGEVNQTLKTKWKSQNFDTISGFIIEKLDRLPKQNEELSVGNYLLKTTNVKGPKILRVRITRKAPVKRA
jgi:CBS domain containing-hemolysin-like protein